MTTRMRWRAVVLLAALGFSTGAAAQKRSYKIALGYPFAPWDVGPLSGVNKDILDAVCKANVAMHCQIQVRPYGECIEDDTKGHPEIGNALGAGHVDACVGWLITPVRQQLGLEFTDAYSFGPIPQLVAAASNTTYDGLGASGSLSGAKVGFLSGFFNDQICLGAHYSGFTPVVFEGDQAGRDAMISALLAHTIDLAFWDSRNTVPEATHLVGAAVTDCGAHLAAVVFPGNIGYTHRADEFRRDFNCGLAIIRAKGILADVCASSTYPGGDPSCILTGPPPTRPCLRDNPGAIPASPR